MNTPRTIEELEYACRERKFPLRAMHIYIGDTDMPSTFGIFKDKETGEVTLYKNTSAGERKVRYQGQDEAQAVGELWPKILELYEMGRKRETPKLTSEARPPMTQPQPVRRERHVRHIRQARHTGRMVSVHRPFSFSRLVRNILGLLAVILIIGAIVSVFNSCDINTGSRGRGFSRGYYTVGNTQYYYRPSSGWYMYEPSLHVWNAYTPPANWAIYDDYSDYYVGTDIYDYSVTDFDEWYEETYPNYSYNYDYGNSGGYDYEDSDYDYGYDSPDWGYDSGSSWDSGSSYDDYNSNFDYNYNYDSNYDWDSDW